MPNFDEAAAVEAPKEGSPEYLIMVCQQHMAWLTVYAEGMTQADWRDMQDRLVSQIGKLVADFAALAALKPFLGGILREKLEHRIAGITEALTPQLVLATHEQKHLDNGSVERTYWHYGYMVALKDVLKQLPASPDKGGE